MAHWQYVEIEIEDRVAVLTIDNPPTNSVNAGVLAELDDAVDWLVEHKDAKATVLVGGGKMAFVAGADIAGIRALIDQPAHDHRAARGFISAGQSLFRKIERAPKPFVAAIHGFCLGGGLELAMACHIRICSNRARMGNTEIRLGLIPGWGGTQRLARLVGQGMALELILTGNMISAQEAYRIGLVNKVVPAADLLNEARDLARTIASKSMLAISATLQAVVGGLELPIDEGLELEAQQFVALADKEDPREGLDAFLEQRQPKFKDR